MIGRDKGITVMKRALVGIVIAVCVIISTGCNTTKPNQEVDKKDWPTEKYPIVQIEELKSKAETGNISFSDFKRDFNVQCIRKTHQGYYVVLLVEEGGNAFVFFDKEDVLWLVLIYDGFKSKKEFQSQVVEQMPESEVLKFDSNAIMTPISAVELAIYIVQEGVFVIQYSRLTDGEMLEDPIVTSIRFLDNDSIQKSEDPFVRYVIPFIFEFDKAPVDLR